MLAVAVVPATIRAPEAAVVGVSGSVGSDQLAVNPRSAGIASDDEAGFLLWPADHSLYVLDEPAEVVIRFGLVLSREN